MTGSYAGSSTHSAQVCDCGHTVRSAVEERDFGSFPAASLFDPAHGSSLPTRERVNELGYSGPCQYRNCRVGLEPT
jgi:hypothetical protein